MGAKENGLPLEYQKKLNAIEPNDYKGKVSEEIEDIILNGQGNMRGGFLKGEEASTVAAWLAEHK